MKRNRLTITMQNMKFLSAMRPKDVVNLQKLWSALPPMQQHAGIHSLPLFPAQMFTSMPMDFRPMPKRYQRPKGHKRLHIPKAEHPLKVGLFSDSMGHLSGVSTTLNHWLHAAEERALPLFVHECAPSPTHDKYICFPATGEIELGDYQGLQLFIPDVDMVYRYIKRQRFDVLHLSTPGPLGLAAFAAATRLGIPVCGTYHTDFPRYVKKYSQSDTLEALTWDFMRWFYRPMVRVASPSHSTKDDLIKHGLDGKGIDVVGRGVDLTKFNPRFRSERVRATWGNQNAFTFIYVGRLSDEKNLSDLCQAYQHLKQYQDNINLVIVGDGPYRAEMEKRLAGTPVHFTGALSGENLSKAYASADCFVFPSKTDTLGIVVIEAQASGLPVIASSEGGPKDCMCHNKTGVVLDQLNAVNLAQAMHDMVLHPERHLQLKRQAVLHAQQFTPEASFYDFWEFNTRVANEAQSQNQAQEMPYGMYPN